MKSAVKNIIGKTIQGIVVKESDESPESQVFLIFDDETYYEFYSRSAINGAGGVDRGGIDAVKNYMPENNIVFMVSAERR